VTGALGCSSNLNVSPFHSANDAKIWQSSMGLSVTALTKMRFRGMKGVAFLKQSDVLDSCLARTDICSRRLSAF
jgi:hypothetical protein